jgi:hypothetical protein
MRKQMKYYLMIVIIFFSIPLYAQNLERKDISIFINGVQEITDFLDSAERDSTAWLEDYREEFSLIYFLLGEILADDIEDEEFDTFKKLYKTFLNYNIPEDYEKLFKKIGWENNGHNKLFTIIIGSSYFLVLSEQVIYNNLRLLEIVNKADLDLIKKHIEEILSIIN